MKTFISFAVLLLALGFISLPCAWVSSATGPRAVTAPNSSAQQKGAGHLAPAMGIGSFIVNSTGDAPDATLDDESCNDGTGNCTLRAAIMEANARTGTSTITFNISPPGPKTIAPSSALPAITAAVRIDGTTQPGFSGTPIIELKGNAGAGPVLLAVAGSNSTIRGLVLNSASGDAIVLMGNNNTVAGNFIGTDLTGTAAGPGCAGAGVAAQGNGNTIGGSEANIIAFNGTGVSVGLGSGNSILANSIFSSAGLGIDLNADGVTGDDSCDGDNGPNGLQNYPVLTAAQSSGGFVAIQGTLNSAASTSYRVDFFAGSACDPSGFGEGETFIGSTTVTTDGGCNAMFSVSFPVSVAVGQFITATGNDDAQDTSEFSQCVAVTAATCLIICPPNQTRNTDPNQCGAAVIYPAPATDGLCGTVTCTPASGSFFPKGTTAVDCVTTATPSCSFSVTVIDNAPPQIICSAGIVTSVDPPKAMAVVDYAFAGFSDNCPGTTAVCLPPSGTVFPIGVSTVTCSATDAAGNTAACSFTVNVKVNDTETPVVRCPANVNAAPAAGQTSAVVNYPAPTVPDNLPDVNVVCSPASGSSFPAGATTVTCTATNAGGNKSSCSFIVGVGGSQAKVTIPGNKTAIEFEAAPTRKPPKPKKNPPAFFAIENTGFAPLVLTFDSIARTGSSVDSGRITDPNDTRFLSLSLVNSDQSLTPLDIDAVLTLQPGQVQDLCAKFAALIPALAGKTTALAASNVLPDAVTSKIVFRQNGGANIAIPIVARVSTALMLINPSNPRAEPEVLFTRSGNGITVSYAVFDSNLDVSRAKYEFLDSSGQVVAGPFEVDLAASLSSANLVRGQSFSVEQRFTGASSHPEITRVRLTVFDGETSAGAPSTSSATSSSAARGARQTFAHTHLVRGGSVMLQPTALAACSPVSAYPPRERWVRDAAAYYYIWRSR